MTFPRELEASERSLFQKMRLSIHRHSKRNQIRRNLHDAKNRLDKVGFSVPPHMVDFQTPLGWAEKSVSVPSARIFRQGFRLPVKSTLLGELDEIFDSPHATRVESGATKSSMKHGPAFMFITPGDTDKGEPKVIFSAKSALEATCIQNPRTGGVTAALELVGKNEALLYLPGIVLELAKDSAGKWLVTDEMPQGHDLVLCEPYIWDWDLDRPFGRSRITRPLIGTILSGIRTLLRQEVTAEFFSAPQRSLLGASEEHFTDKDGNPIDIWKLITGGIWGLPDTWDDDEGKLVRPELKQLQQASMQPHSEMFNGIVLRAASELQMPVSYLGVQHNQPQNEGAIRAEEASMIALIEHQINISYSLAAVNLARKALAVFHNKWDASMAKDLRGLSARFADPGTPTIQARSDAALKYNQAFPNGDPEVAMEMYGLTDDQIKRNLSYARLAEGKALLLGKLADGSASEDAAVEPADSEPGNVDA